MKSLAGVLAMNLVKILAAGNFSSCQALGEISGKIMAGRMIASRSESWQDSRQDYGRRQFRFPPGIPAWMSPGFWLPGFSFPPRILPGFLLGFPMLVAINPVGSRSHPAGIPGGIPARYPQDPGWFFIHRCTFLLPIISHVICTFKFNY